MCRACQCTFNTPDLQGRPAHLVIKHRGSASRSEALLWQSHDSETARDRTFTKAWGTAACRKQVEPTKQADAVPILGVQAVRMLFMPCWASTRLCTVHFDKHTSP